MMRKKKNRFRNSFMYFLFFLVFPPSIYSLVLTSDTNGKLMTVPFIKKKKEESNKNRKVKKEKGKMFIQNRFFFVNE